MLLNNRYQVLQTLGSGGFGKTFIAEDTHMPSGRWCVVKQLHPISNDPQTYQLIKERFQREAAILEDLGSQSDRIPTLYAYCEENNEFYLVQELIEGKTLAATLQQKGMLSESQVENFLANFLPILDYIHNKQIIHRDIKPDNIIIRQSDNKPVLIDFGAVKEAMGTQVNLSGSQAGSIIIGTPGFMPSEQAAGRPVYSSDLYATGLTAIYLLTGRLPQDIETDSYTGELIWKQYMPKVRPTLATILNKAIHSNARERYTTAQEMFQALLQSPVNRVSSNNKIKAGVSSPSKLGDLQKTLLIGSFIGVAIFAGFFIIKQSQKLEDSQQAIPNLEISEKASPKISQTESIGWIRLGAVKNTSGFASIGEPLIVTTQPITINPKIVPAINSQVKIITGVNLRKNVPQPPNYKLEKRVNVLLENQQLKILSLKTFVDTASTSPYTVVWAEVAIP
ncbi:serine/threonine protein kinase [Lusitaniella coriacea LEGE 07157]|uniref:non-specific serine/threonine protein kinase n=1 Tax=Lusitaniella coriacea LEGE 07157 TaxID=945747 RepID=A0A8J7E2M7_9CYAN|nr:serine/threonine-protein kinase [Lusitaniella coriacea]MBE9118586.1 serine/threonine protein kinase [Lusitaniella coriacea LEGE 07157]